jgi:lactate dehydrogenase-like 2-hydroxyacid dehydrogenase
MDKKYEVLLTHPVHAGTQATMEFEFQVYRLWEARSPDALIAELAPRLTAIAGGKGCGASFLDRFPELGIVANFGVGYDNIDAVYCAKRGIRVTNTPGVLDDEVADTAIGILLCLARKFVLGDRFVREGRWLYGPMPLTASLAGKTMGLVGLGRIGSRIAELAVAHRMKVVYHTRRPKDAPYAYYADLLRMAREVDVLMLIVPGGEGTKDLVDRRVMEALGKDGLLVNVSRGSVVDEEAMIELLQNGSLGGAGLDVFADEPRVPQALIDLSEKVVLQPHVGSATEETRTAMGRLMMDNLHAFFTGKSLLSEVPETAAVTQSTIH